VLACVCTASVSPHILLRFASRSALQEPFYIYATFTLVNIGSSADLEKLTYRIFGKWVSGSAPQQSFQLWLPVEEDSVIPVEVSDNELLPPTCFLPVDAATKFAVD